MTGVDDLIASFTSRQKGLVALWQTRGVGIPDHLVIERIRRGVLIRMHDGVYRLRGVPYTQELRWLAAVLAGGPEAWLSHRAGAMFHGYETRFLRPEITIAHERECHLEGIVTHRTRRWHDVITVRGVPVTTKARTALDCAAVMSPSAFREMLEHAVTGGVVTVEALLAALQHRGGRGVEGTVLLRDTLAWVRRREDPEEARAPRRTDHRRLSRAGAGPPAPPRVRRRTRGVPRQRVAGPPEGRGGDRSPLARRPQAGREDATAGAVDPSVRVGPRRVRLVRGDRGRR